MPLKSQVFPPEDITRAGMLQKQNNATKAALEAASFVEGFSVFADASVQYSTPGDYTLLSGELKARADQYVQFVGAGFWTAGPTAQGLSLRLYLDGNASPTLTLADGSKQASGTDETTALPIHRFFKMPRTNPQFRLVCSALSAGVGTVALFSFGFFRFSGGPT